jgi:hypothetical protein
MTNDFDLDEIFESLLSSLSDNTRIGCYKVGFNLALDIFLNEFKEAIPRHNPVTQTVENIIEKLKRE